jgi:hypothetical protein
MSHQYDIHGIVSVWSTVPLLDGAYHRYFRVEDTESADPDSSDVALDVGDHVDVEGVPASFVEGPRGVYGREGADTVFFEGPSGRGSLSGLNSGEIHVRAENRACIPGGLWDLYEVAVDLLLLRRGYMTVHGASLCRGDAGLLLSGFPKVGKTLATLSLLERGYSYLGDDNSYVSRKGRVSCYPSLMNLGYEDFRQFVSPSDVGWASYVRQLASVVPTRSRLLSRVVPYPEVYLPDVEAYDQRDSASASVVCCLERGPRTVERIDTDAAASKVRTATAYSRPRLCQNPLVRVHSYFNESDVDALRAREREVLQDFLDDAECFVVACQNRDWDVMLERVEDKATGL